MQFVLSLIASPAKALLSSHAAARAGRALEAAGAQPGPPVWLSPGEACDIPFDGDAARSLAAAREAHAGAPWDVNVVAASGRRKKLLVADMDSTLIEQECIDELAEEVGLRDNVAKITERAMRGEVAFEPALRERVALMKGLPVAAVDRVLAERITLMPGAIALVATMRAAGARCALVSGGFTLFTRPIAERIGFDEQSANVLDLADDSLAGTVAEPILGREAKEEMLVALTARLGLRSDETMAVGDGANDISMIRRAGLGVAYRAKPALRAAAHAVIDHADLTGLLFLQGYTHEEFAR